MYKVIHDAGTVQTPNTPPSQVERLRGWEGKGLSTVTQHIGQQGQAWIPGSLAPGGCRNPPQPPQTPQPWSREIRGLAAKAGGGVEGKEAGRYMTVGASTRKQLPAGNGTGPMLPWA